MKRIPKTLLALSMIFLVVSSAYAFLVTHTIQVSVNIVEFIDTEPPAVTNVRHEPLYPNSTDTIHFYANVTDNVDVALVQLNYTVDSATWFLKTMQFIGNASYYTSLDPFPQGVILGFYIVAYDSAGNVGYGSEIVPPLPEPPRAAPIVISDLIPIPLPDGRDVRYNTTGGGIEIIVNVTEIGIYDPLVSYNITYSLDGGLTWIVEQMTQIGDVIWKYLIDATTNIIFKILASDGSAESRIYWIIVGPWKYPIYLHFSTEELFFPVAGLDFDGDDNVSNNWISYHSSMFDYIDEFKTNDLDQDGTPDVWSYAYMHPKTLDDGCLILQYWIYYAFNRYPIVGEIFRDDHEHDYESVSLWIDLATGNIKKMVCNQHKWVNHYVFDVNNPPKAINLAVEIGGHGMALLKDGDNDGFPDVNVFGWYIILPGVNRFGIPELFPLPWQDFWTINPNSFRAQLHPWVIYDPRIPSSELHLFDDVSTLTNGLALDALLPFLPAVVGDTPQYYAFLTELLGVECVLKTTFGAPFLGDSKLVFCVIAPLFRQEFREPWRMWNKVSFGWWLVKKTVGLVIDHFVKGRLKNYFKVAGARGLLIGAAGKLAGRLADEIISVFVDPTDSVVIDAQDGVLGYSDKVNDLLGGMIFAARNTTNDLYDMYLIFTNSSNEYTYKLTGIQYEDYNFTISLLDTDGNEVNFTATAIPINTSETHQFSMNWTKLEEGGFGVRILIDRDGDGTSDHQLSSDSELTKEEVASSLGDINLDGKIDMKDIGQIARAFATEPGVPLWDPLADITGPEYAPDEKVDMRDVGQAARHFGEFYP